jgi:nucleotide-binding universal stress UspA family protein
LFKKIIVPLDGSSTAEVALPYAEEMAARLACELILIFVKEEYERRSDNVFRAYLEYMVQKAGVGVIPHLKGTGRDSIDFSTKLLAGNPAEEIIDFAERQKGSLIIMATHGKSGVDTRWLMGSVAEKVIEASTCPVVLLRAIGDKPTVRTRNGTDKILVPLDGSKESEMGLPIVKEIASQLNSEVTIMHILKIDRLLPLSKTLVSRSRARVEKYLDKVVVNFEKSGIHAKPETIITYDEIAQNINQYTKDNEISLVIMVTHGLSGKRSVITGGSTYNVLMDGNTPIMVIRSPKT